MIRFLNHNEIDFEKWDHCIEKSINGIIYPYSFYLDQVSPGWAALVKEDYDSVMPLPVKKKWGINYIMQPVFVQQLGIFSPNPVNEILIKMFLESIPGKYSFININLNTFNIFSGLRKASLTENVTYELDLIQTYPQLQGQYSENSKRNLQKAKKNRVFVTKNSNPDPIIESFRSNRGRNIKTLDDAQYNCLKHLIYSGMHRGYASVYTAYSAENTFCAGIVFFHSHKKSILIFSGSTPEAKKNGAMTAIIDTFIKEHCEQELTLDFEGSNNKNLARFYAGFGSKEYVYLQVRINKFPLFLNQIVNAYFRFRSMLN